MYSSYLNKFDEVTYILATSGSPGWSLTFYVLAITFQPLVKEFRKMKQVFLRSALALAVALGASTAYAQTGGGYGEGHGHGQRMSADQRLEMLTQQLSLSNDQQQQIKPILENETQQMQTLRSDTSLSQQDHMSKMKAIRENTNSQIKPILTADQQTKWQQMMERHGRHGGPQEAPQSPQQ